jgi:hypothetical protein
MTMGFAPGAQPGMEGQAGQGARRRASPEMNQQKLMTGEPVTDTVGAT